MVTEFGKVVTSRRITSGVQGRWSGQNRLSLILRETPYRKQLANAGLRWPKGLADNGIGLYAAGPNQVKAVGNRGEYCVQADGDRRRFAGQIDDQRRAARACCLTRQNGRGHFFKADAAHQLAEARQLLFQHDLHRLRREIAWAGTGSAGGEDEIDPFFVAEPHKFATDIVDTIGNHLRQQFVGRGDGPVEPCGDRWPRQILVFAACGTIGDG